MGKDSHSGVYFLILFCFILCKRLRKRSQFTQTFAMCCVVILNLHYKVTAFLLKYVLCSSSDCDFMLYIKSYSDIGNKKRECTIVLAHSLYTYAKKRYLTSMFFITFASFSGVVLGMTIVRRPSATFADILSRSTSSGRV